MSAGGDKLKSFGILLGGLGLIFMGIAALTYVFRGPPKSSQEQLIEKYAQETFESIRNKDASPTK